MEGERREERVRVREFGVSGRQATTGEVEVRQGHRSRGRTDDRHSSLSLRGDTRKVSSRPTSGGSREDGQVGGDFRV